MNSARYRVGKRKIKEDLRNLPSFGPKFQAIRLRLECNFVGCQWFRGSEVLSKTAAVPDVSVKKIEPK